MEYRKLISIEVRGDHIYSDKVSIGAVGTQNVTALDLFFDEQWEGLNPIVFWFNAMDHETQVAETILTSENKIEEGHYRVTIPHEVFEYKGNAAFVVEGTTVIDEAVVSLPTEYGYLIVRGSSNEVMDIPSEDDPLSILQQVQNLENLANEHAESAALSASNAEESANNASQSEHRIYAEVDAAEGFAYSSRDFSDVSKRYAQQSQGYANTAQSYVVDSQGFADDARSSATSAGQSAAQSEASAEAAETQAQAATRSENNAAAYASQAQTYKSAAEMAQARVEASESAAQSYAAQAQGYAEAAAQDFDTLSDELEAHTSDTDIHITPEERARWNAGGGGGGGTNDYNALSNKPSIGGVTLSGNKTLADLGFSTADCEKLSNKVTAIDGATATDMHYPSEKAVADALITLSSSLSSSFGNQINGLAQSMTASLAHKEDSSNKVDTIELINPESDYPNANAVANFFTSMRTSSTTTTAANKGKIPTFGTVIDYVDARINSSLGSIESALDTIIGGE